MVEYEYVTLHQLLASYMYKFKTKSISFLELKQWANYVKKNFKVHDYQVIPLLTKESISSFTSDHMFYKTEKMFCLNEDISLDDLGCFCSKMSQQLLLLFTFKTNDFTPTLNNENTL